MSDIISSKQINIDLSKRIEEKSIIILPEVRRSINAQIEKLASALNKVSSRLNSTLREQIKEEALNILIDNLVSQSTQKKGKLKESKYWFYKQKLEEAILKIVKRKLDYENLFGKWSSDKKHNKKVKERYDFAPLLYLHLGICGGAYAIADKTEDRIILQHNLSLQKEFQKNNDDVPFIDIPYRYTYDARDKVKQSEYFRKVLDAMYISIRQGQTLTAKTDYSPEFYLYMRHLLHKKERKKLLPYESKMAKNNFKFIYCTVGEVLFHLFAWRMLVRKAQFKGIKHEVTQDSFRAFDIHRSDFWKEVKGYELPENDWIEKLNTSFKDVEIETTENTPTSIKEMWEKEFVENIDKAGYRKEEKEAPFTMWEEYKLLGMIKKDAKGKWIFTRDFLEMIRYTIHITGKHLRWKVDLSPQQQKIQRSLHVLERRLDAYYQENSKQHDPTSRFYPSYEKLKRHLPIIHSKGDKYPGKRINDCLLAIVKLYLLEGKDSEVIPELLRHLHVKCRFPIIPYYYELAVGKQHNPKEHLVFCLWDSNKNPIKLPLHNNEGKNNDSPKFVEESGVAFVLLTINPIWTIRPEYNLMKNGKSLHYTSKLSEESFNRLFRLYEFFSLLARPIIDEIFYGRLIKNNDMANLLESEISSFSHELGKITQQIFENSNNSLDDFFGSNKEKVVECLAQNVVGNLKPNANEVKTWHIIPDYRRFKSWSSNLFVWAGNERELLFSLKEEDNLANILNLCLDYSKTLYTGNYSLRTSSKPRNYNDVFEYNKYFDTYNNELSGFLFKEDPNNILDHMYLISKEKYDKDLLKKKKITKAQNAFIRLLISTLVNVHEHTRKKDFGVKVSLEKSNPPMLNFQFVNCFNKPEKGAKTKQSLGTLPVLKTCLRMIKDEKPYIRFEQIPDEEKELKKGFSEKLMKKKDEELWLTEYKIEISDIAEYR